MGIDSAMDSFVAPVAQALATVVFFSVPLAEGAELKLVVLWLVLACVFFTVYLRFVGFRYFGHGLSALFGRHPEPGARGEIGNFQTLSACLSATVGLGNIAGVAVAVSVGGAGAVFWMAVMGFLGMAVKFAEVTLGVKYRIHPDPAHPHKVSGGPMYYIRSAFAQRNMPRTGGYMAAFFALCCVGASLGGGNMFQGNQAFQQFVTITGGADSSFFADKGWLFGLVLAVMVGLVIIGGIRTIGKAASVIVPFMAGLYMLGALVVIVLNISALPTAGMEILSAALTWQAGFGAFLGGIIMGVQRAVFSNEAGTGTAAIVHAAAKTGEPVRQGFVGMLGPFIDTVVICMLTALVIVITGAHHTGGQGMEGVALTSRAFEQVLPHSQYVLAVIVFLFAYSTMIAWFYYGLKCITYLLGEKPLVETGFKLIFCVFVVIGACLDLENIILITDSMFFAMVVPNGIALCLLAKEVRTDLKDYAARYVEGR